MIVGGRRAGSNSASELCRRRGTRVKQAVRREREVRRREGLKQEKGSASSQLFKDASVLWSTRQQWRWAAHGTVIGRGEWGSGTRRRTWHRRGIGQIQERDTNLEESGRGREDREEGEVREEEGRGKEKEEGRGRGRGTREGPDLENSTATAAGSALSRVLHSHPLYLISRVHSVNWRTSHPAPCRRTPCSTPSPSTPCSRSSVQPYSTPRPAASQCAAPWSRAWNPSFS
jgi:hypothetical protein